MRGRRSRRGDQVPSAARVGKASGNGANLGFEATLWRAADKLRNNMDAAEYKHVVLGLIFLKYISDAFQERYQALTADKDADPEDRDEYTAENVFWVPKEARWGHIQGKAKQATIGKVIVANDPPSPAREGRRCRAGKPRLTERTPCRRASIDQADRSIMIVIARHGLRGSDGGGTPYAAIPATV
jgi:HsdM N-terminal domain